MLTITEAFSRNFAIAYNSSNADSILGAWCITRSVTTEGVYSVLNDFIANAGGKYAIVLGLAVTEELLQELCTRATLVVLVGCDKESAYRSSAKYTNLSVGYCTDDGIALSAWKMMYGDASPPKLIKAVNDHYAGGRVLPDTPAMISGLATLGLTLSNANHAIADTDLILDDGKAIVTNNRLEAFKIVASGAQIANWMGYEIPILNALPGVAEHVAEDLIKQHAFVVTYYDIDGETRRFDFRSDRDFNGDIVEITRPFNRVGDSSQISFGVPYGSNGYDMFEFLNKYALSTPT